MISKRLLKVYLFVSLALLSAKANNDLPKEESDLQDFSFSTQRYMLGKEFFEYFHQNFTESALGSARLNIETLKCINDLRIISQGISNTSLWSLKFIDAWGSIPSGVLNGNLYDLGNFDECLMIHKEITKNHITSQIKGQYCLANLPLSVPILKWVRIAICMPASCSAQTINPLLRDFFNNKLNLNLESDFSTISPSSCQTDESSTLDGLAIFTIVLLSTLALIVLGCTIYEYLFVHNSKMHPLVRCFSLCGNSRDLFSTVDQSKKPNVITALNGMRCLSLIWVIYAHDYLMAGGSPNINSLKMYYWRMTPYSHFLLHAQFSVDTFFFISGLLIVMVVMREMNKREGKLNVPLMYLHRYLRLTPLLGVAILVYMSLLPYLGKAPLWGTVIFDNYDNCKKHWWETLLYVQNYAAHHNMCINHSWYLAVDMQLYLLSPIFLYALWKWGKKALAGIIILTLLLSAYTFTIIAMGKYSLFFKTGERNHSQYHLYFATHNHAVPWLIGFIFGYCLHIARGKKINLPKYIVWLGWLASLAVFFTSIFALYPKMQSDAGPLSPLADASYTVFTRAGWPLALCWIVFACMNGFGGPANSFLSSPLWQPLSKISYGCYIWHVLLENISAGSTHTSTYFSDYQIILRFWGDFGMTVLVSIFFYLIFEAPLAALEIYLLPSNKKSFSKDQVLTTQKLMDDKKTEGNLAIISEQEVTPKTS